MLDRNLVEDIQKSMVKNWNKPLFSDYGGQEKTYGHVAQRILFWHEMFAACQIKPNDKIAVLGRNSANWAEIFLATISYGAVVVPILSDFSSENVHHIVNHSDAIFLFAAENNFDSLSTDKMKKLEAVFSLNDFSLLYVKNKSCSQRVEKAWQDHSKSNQKVSSDQFEIKSIANTHICEIVYTSGTTGFSKGVMLSLHSLTTNVVYAQNNMPLSAGDKILSFLPMAHAYACAFEFLFPVTMGCHIIFLNKLPTPQILIKAFSEIKPKLIFLVPLLIEKIYKNKIKPTLQKPVMRLLIKTPLIQNLVYGKIRKSLVDLFGGEFIEIIIGGAALNKEVEVFLRKINFPFTIGYGMTECGPLISYSSWDTIKPHSVGKLINYLEAKIEKEDTQQNVGEIMVRGDNVMYGYYKNQEATKNTLEEDGWLHTGDLGEIDEEGFIFIRGRSKNMLLGPSGQNIYPEEIESMLNNMDFVQESLVMEGSENKLIALVYPDYELADANKLDETTLKEKMAENLKSINHQLPNYCKLSKINLFPEEFEKTPTKKIKRYLYTSHS